MNRTVTMGGRTALVPLVMILGAACGKSPAPSQCLQFAADLMPPLAGGLIRKDFRLANAWAIKAEQPIDSSGVKLPAYFLSADIIAPNGEAVVGTWLNTDVTKAGLVFSGWPPGEKKSMLVEEGDWFMLGGMITKPGKNE